MHSDFWHKKWEQGEIGFHQEAINSHLQAFWPDLTVAAGGTIFVPLCGKTRDMLWLRDRGHPVIGVEISPIAVEDFFRENRLTPQVSRAGYFTHYRVDGLEILCGDFFQLTAEDLGGVNAVYDRAALVALPPAIRTGYVEHLFRILPPDCPILLVTFDYDQKEMPGPPFAVAADEVNALYARRYRIEQVFREDVMAGGEAEHWREKGLSALAENVYRLTPT